MNLRIFFRRALIGAALVTYLASVLVPSFASALTVQDFHALTTGTPFYDPNGLCKVTEETEVDTAHPATDIPLDDRGKLAQLLFVRADSGTDTANLVAKHVGGIFLGNDAVAVDDGAIRTLKASASPMPLLSVDEEGGRVQKLDTKYGSMPSARAMGAMTDQAVTDIADARGKIMANIGINMDFAPVVDVSDQPANGVIGDRSFSNNSLIVTAKANAFAAGLRKNKILPVFKHFPGHGHSTGDSHSGAVSVPPLDQLRASDLVPYTNVMKQGDSGVMVGHLDVPGLTLPNEPASISKPAIDLLRGEFGFNGLVVTDELAGMHAISDRYGLPEAVSRAIRAGNDMALFVGVDKVDGVLDKLMADLTSGALPRARLDDAIAHIQQARQFTGLANQTGEAQQIATQPDGSGQPSATPVASVPKTSMGGSDNLINLFIKAGQLTGVPAGALAAQSYQESGSYWNAAVFTNDFVLQHSYLEGGGKIMLPPQYQNVNYIGASGPMQLDQWSGPGDYHGNYSPRIIAKFKELTGVDFPPHGEFYFDTAIIMGAIVDKGVADRHHRDWTTIDNIIANLTDYGTIPSGRLREQVITKFKKNYTDFTNAIGGLVVYSSNPAVPRTPDPQCNDSTPATPDTVTVSPDVGTIDAATLPRLRTTYTPDMPGIQASRKPNVLTGKSLAASYGWDKGNEWLCLYDLYVRESGWNEKADNPTSSAYGIPQALPGRKMSSEGSDWATNPATQIKWGLKYIKGRYITPCETIKFHNIHNWY